MKRIVFLLLFVAFLVGCNKAWNMENLLPQPKESICNTIPEGESFICERLRNPEFAHMVLYLADAAVLDGMTLAEIEKEEKVVTEAIWWLEQGSLTYAIFQTLVMETSGSLIAIAASQQIAMFEFNDDLILAADRGMMVWSLNQVLGLIEIAKNQNL